MAPGRRLRRWALTWSIAVTRRIAYRRRLTGATIVAALMVNAPTATAQTQEQKSRIRAGIDEAIQAVDHLPGMEKMSPRAKR